MSSKSTSFSDDIFSDLPECDLEDIDEDADLLCSDLEAVSSSSILRSPTPEIETSIDCIPFSQSFSNLLLEPDLSRDPENPFQTNASIATHASISSRFSYHIENITNIRDAIPEWDDDDVEEILIMTPKLATAPSERASFVDADQSWSTETDGSLVAIAPDSSRIYPGEDDDSVDTEEPEEENDTAILHQNTEALDLSGNNFGYMTTPKSAPRVIDTIVEESIYSDEDSQPSSPAQEHDEVPADASPELSTAERQELFWQSIDAECKSEVTTPSLIKSWSRNTFTPLSRQRKMSSQHNGTRPFTSFSPMISMPSLPLPFTLTPSSLSKLPSTPHAQSLSNLSKKIRKSTSRFLRTSSTSSAFVTVGNSTPNLLAETNAKSPLGTSPSNKDGKTQHERSIKTIGKGIAFTPDEHVNNTPSKFTLLRSKSMKFLSKKPHSGDDARSLKIRLKHMFVSDDSTPFSVTQAKETKPAMSRYRTISVSAAQPSSPLCSNSPSTPVCAWPAYIEAAKSPDIGSSFNATGVQTLRLVTDEQRRQGSTTFGLYQNEDTDYFAKTAGGLGLGVILDQQC